MSDSPAEVIAAVVAGHEPDYAEHIAEAVLADLRDAGWELYRPEACRVAVFDAPVWFDGLLGIEEIADGAYYLVPVESPGG